MAEIQKITAKEIKDSRGNPTIEVIATSRKDVASACVPSGASTGTSEVIVVPVAKAIENIETIISPKLAGQNPIQQVSVDKTLIELSALGGNTIVGVSMAVARLGAKTRKKPLYQHLRSIFDSKLTGYRIPEPFFNILNGGAHASNDLAIQEFMIKPRAKNFAEQLEIGKKVYKKLEIILKKDFSNLETGDEGGYAPELSFSKDALDYLIKADENKETDFVLDCAASQFYKIEDYLIDGQNLGRNQLLKYYSELVEKYPIVALEDPFDEQDWKGFKRIFQELGDNVLIIGDDLLVTNPSLIQRAAKDTVCNGVIIKINQIGTVSQAMKAALLAKQFAWKTIVSHRSGETMDDFIADFAVGINADYIKSGAPGPAERMVKYNRLLEISNEV